MSREMRIRLTQSSPAVVDLEKAADKKAVTAADVDRLLEEEIRELEPEEQEGGVLAAPRLVQTTIVASLCLFDFASDVASARAFAHSGVEEVRLLGYAAAACLGLASVINLLIVVVHKRKYRDLYAVLRQRAPCFEQLVLLLALSNSEVQGMEVAVLKSDLHELEQKLEATRAETDVKRHALISQLVEDLPQLSLQIAASTIQARSGNAIPSAALFSMALGVGMLCLKAVSNLLLWMLRVDAPVQVLNSIARDERRTVSVTSAITSCSSAEKCGFLLQLLVVISSFPLAAALKFRGAPDLHRFDQLLCDEADEVLLQQGQVLWAVLALGILAVLLISFLLSLLTIFVLLRHELGKAWHMQLRLGASVVLVVLSTVHPAPLHGVSAAGTPAIPPERRLCSCGAVPFVRSMLLMLIGVEAIWKDEAPVHERLLIAYTIAAAAAWMQLLANIATSPSGEDIGYQSVPEVLSSAPPLMEVEKVEVLGSAVLSLADKLRTATQKLRQDIFDESAFRELAGIYAESTPFAFVDLAGVQGARQLLQACCALMRSLPPGTLDGADCITQADVLMLQDLWLASENLLVEIVAVLKSHDAIGSVAKACRLLTLLCNDPSADEEARHQRRQRITAAGALLSIVAALRLHASSSFAVAGAASHAIVSICDASVIQRSQQAVDAGALESLVAALRAHGTSTIEVAHGACSAIANLVYGSDAQGQERKQRAATTGALEAAVAALEAHCCRSAAVAEHASRAIANICARNDAEGGWRKQQAVTAGALECLVRALQVHSGQSADVAGHAGRAIANMCSGADAEVVQRKQRAVLCGAHEQMTAAVALHPGMSFAAFIEKMAREIEQAE